MPGTKPKVTVRIPKALKLTPAEIATLKKAFKMDITDVLSKKPGELPPFPEINVGSGRPRSGGAKKKSGSKKAGKKK
jgi:hypothetical protein